MIDLLLRHLFESTLFCLVMAALAACFRPHHSASRYALWLIGVSKFAVPAVLLKAAGAKLAFMLPAPAWMSLAAAKFSALLAVLFGFLPRQFGRAEMIAAHNILILSWIGVAALLFGRWAIKFERQELRVTRPKAFERYALGRACLRLGMSRGPRICSVEGGPGPGLHGIFRQRVIMPRDLSKKLEPEEFESVLLHELAHAKRHDNLAAALVHALVCLFWFHPLLWLAEKRVGVERERACDQAVVRAGIPPETYAAGIAKACRFQLWDSVAGRSGITHSDLESRLQLIRSHRIPHRALRFAPQIVLAGFAVLITLLPMAGGYCEQCVSIVHSPTRPLHKP